MLEKKTISLPSPLYDKKATYYYDPDCKAKAVILYFHGGGLLYGRRTDLPMMHLFRLTSAGYPVLSFDYPLAPAVHMDEIFADVCDSVKWYIDHPEETCEEPLPYFLWGRSAGAYLALLAAAWGEFPLEPSGIISFYGYGFLTDRWYNEPSPYYKTLPAVPPECLEAIPQGIHAEGDLDSHYSVYVYARQTGLWKDLIYEGREKYFYLRYSLRLCDKLPAPLFAVHCTGDPDVPFTEFREIVTRYAPERFIVMQDVHDFDRNEMDPVTQTAIGRMITFCHSKL